MSHAAEHLASAYGGSGWSPRPLEPSTDRAHWGPGWGAENEWGQLRAVLLHRAGPELEGLQDASSAQMTALPDPDALRREQDGLVQLFEREGVRVEQLEPGDRTPPNQLFCCDGFVMTPEGAIVSRMASTVRAGEERWVARRLAALGVPILLTVRGPGVFEGRAELTWVDRETVLLSQGLRTNRCAAEQISGLLARMGVRVVPVGLPLGVMHLLGTVNILGPDLAAVWPGRVPWEAVQVLRERGYQILVAPDEDELQGGMALNFVTLGPRRIVMPAGCPRTRSLYEAHGVTCLELDVSETKRAEGALGCLTGVLERG